MNGVGKRCAGEPHAPFDRGPLAKQQPRRAGPRAPDGKPEGLSPVAYHSLTSQRPTSQASRAGRPDFYAEPVRGHYIRLLSPRFANRRGELRPGVQAANPAWQGFDWEETSSR